MIISINAEKLFSNPTAFNDKNTQQTRKRKRTPQSDKDIYKKQTANSSLIVKDWKLPCEDQAQDKDVCSHHF